MNNLFDNFDLTMTPTIEVPKDLPKQTKVDNSRAKNITNQNLFGGQMEEFNIELNKPKVDVLLNKLNNTEETKVEAAKVLKSKSLNKKNGM